MIERPPAGRVLSWHAQAAIDYASSVGVDWWVWRVVASDRMKDGLADIRRHWSFADLFEAQVVIDTLDAMKPDPEE